MKKIFSALLILFTTIIAYLPVANAQFGAFPFNLFALSGTDNPSVVAKSATKETIYIKTSAPTGIYRKTDNGLSTNWTLIVSSTPSGGVPTQIGFFDGGGALASETAVDPDSFTWDETNNFLGIQNANPQSVLHVFSDSTVGTVDPTAIILGPPHPTNNIGQYALIEGDDNTASGAHSHAEGAHTIASGGSSHAEGDFGEASGNASHVEGNNSIASGASSHAEGNTSTASANYAHAEGNNTTASGIGSHSEGTTTSASNASSHAEGNGSIASGQTSHAEGVSTTASNTAAHSEGSNTVASGVGSHAEGQNSTASGASSHAEGSATTAGGIGSHSQGSGTSASGDFSHAGGSASISDGSYSFAQGRKAQNGGFAGALNFSDSANFTSTNNSANQAKFRYSSGYRFVKGGGSNNNDGVNYEIIQASVATTDNTVTTIQTITPSTDQVLLIEARILGRRTDGVAGTVGDSSSFVVFSKCKNVAGVVSTSGVSLPFIAEDNTNTDATITASGLDCLVRVTGDTDNEYTWHTTTKVQRN